jgi:transposase-like protein
MSVLNQPHFHDEAAAFAKLEAVVWPNGPVCPHCGETERVYALNGVKDKKGRVRLGLKKCGFCRKQFRVTVGTVFESSHIPLHKWLQAFHLLCSSKKGISSHQLHRILEVTYETAWFMSHRIREAMRTGPLAPPMGGDGGIVEADETFIGQRPGTPRRGRRPSAYRHKYAVLTLVERGGEARSFSIDHASGKTVVPIIRQNVSKEATIATDEARHYTGLRWGFAAHESVNHTDQEYARGEVHTNTVEGYFALFKRGMKGIYQHCSEKHLHRYLAEFDFRYSNRSAVGVEDQQRADRALKGIRGKRLTYRGTGRSETEI